MPIIAEERWVNWVDALSDNSYVIVDDFLPEELFRLVRSYFLHHLTSDDFNTAGIGDIKHRAVNRSIRGDAIFWVDKQQDQEIAPVFTLVEEMIAIFNRLCFLSLSGYEFHLAYYPKGAFYRKHLDQFKDRNNRLISVIVYLNDSWQQGDGGELVLYHEDDSQTLVAPLRNRCVMFRSDVVPHEVLPTHIGRYSLTGWLLYQPPSLGYILG